MTFEQFVEKTEAETGMEYHTHRLQWEKKLVKDRGGCESFQPHFGGEIALFSSVPLGTKYRPCTFQQSFTCTKLSDGTASFNGDGSTFHVHADEVVEILPVLRHHESN